MARVLKFTSIDSLYHPYLRQKLDIKVWKQADPKPTPRTVFNEKLKKQSPHELAIDEYNEYLKDPAVRKDFRSAETRIRHKMMSAQMRAEARAANQAYGAKKIVKKPAKVVVASAEYVASSVADSDFGADV